LSTGAALWDVIEGPAKAAGIIVVLLLLGLLVVSTVWQLRRAPAA
jgi:hypothetical protein